jgi:hypothetical protein
VICKEYLKTTNVHTALGATSKQMLNPNDNTDSTSTAQFLDKRCRNLNAFCLCYFCCWCRHLCSDQECIITETTLIYQEYRNWGITSICPRFENLRFKSYPLMLILSQQKCVSYTVTCDTRILCCGYKCDSYNNESFNSVIYTLLTL